jgi:hypothetical protein
MTPLRDARELTKLNELLPAELHVTRHAAWFVFWDRDRGATPWDQVLGVYPSLDAVRTKVFDVLEDLRSGEEVTT